MNKPILCLDFDGVLHSYTSGWKGADVIEDPPVLGMHIFILDALENFEVHIYSSRSNQPGGIDAMKRWLENHLGGMFGDSFGEEVVSRLQFPTVKPPAFLTIDDRCWQFNGVFPSIEQIVAFRPWNKRGDKK